LSAWSAEKHETVNIKHSDCLLHTQHTQTQWVSAYAAWHQMVPVCLERWCTEANEATQTHCYNPVALAYPIWAYYKHGRQPRCQEDPLSLPSGRLQKKTRSSPHHVAQHRPTGSETTPLYAPWSSRFGSEPRSVEDDVDIWCYAILGVASRQHLWSATQQLLVVLHHQLSSYGRRVLCGWSVGLEFPAGQLAESDYCRQQFQTISEDVSVCKVLMHSAH